jgi:hypothetical protein
MSVRPSIRMEQLGSQWMDFHEGLYFSIFKKSVEKIQVSSKFGKNNRTLQEDQYTCVIISLSFLLKMRNIS